MMTETAGIQIQLPAFAFSGFLAPPDKSKAFRGIVYINGPSYRISQRVVASKTFYGVSQNDSMRL